MKKKKKESPMRKMMFFICDKEDEKKREWYAIRCPNCKKRMEDFNTITNVFECKCGLNWKLTFTPVGRKLVKKTTIKRRKK